jgi:hypothetical protein
MDMADKVSQFRTDATDTFGDITVSFSTKGVTVYNEAQGNGIIVGQFMSSTTYSLIEGGEVVFSSEDSYRSHFVVKEGEVMVQSYKSSGASDLLGQQC